MLRRLPRLVSVDDLFAPPGAAWRRVSPRLALVRRCLLALWSALVLGLLLLAQVLTPWSWTGLAGVTVLVLGVAGWAWWLIGRSARRWGYAEEDEELYITRGALSRALVVVPYGRMQFVDVHAGPLDQLLGIAEVRLHTASPATTAVIPGLPAEEAARLRDRLTERGETRGAGL